MFLLLMLGCALLMCLALWLKTLNPQPLTFAITHQWAIKANIVEVLATAAGTGLVLAALAGLRGQWLASAERRRAEQLASDLRTDNTALRRDAENLRSETKLLEARLAESEERYAQLQAEVRPLLTMQREPLLTSQPEPSRSPSVRTPRRVVKSKPRRPRGRQR